MLNFCLQTLNLNMAAPLQRLPLNHRKPSRPRRNKQGLLIHTLLQRSITGQRVNVEIHHHTSTTLHLVYSNDYIKDAEHRDRCFEREYSSTAAVNKLRKQFTLFPIDGTCTCTIDRQHDPSSWYRAMFCTRRPTFLPTGHTARTRNLLGFCKCPVTSSEYVSNTADDDDLYFLL